MKKPLRMIVDHFLHRHKFIKNVLVIILAILVLGSLMYLYHGESLVVEKNEEYWDEDHPKVDKITFKPVPEDGSRIASLKTGEADLIYPVPVNDVDSYVDSLKEEDDLDVDIQESTYVNYATINTSKVLGACHLRLF